MSLSGKKALVFGASRGSGRRIAVTLAQAGADVAVAARTTTAGQSDLPGTLAETVAEIEQLGRVARSLPLDASVPGEVDRVCAAAIETLGGVDILVHSLQYFGPGYSDRLTDTPAEELEKHLAVGLTSALRACRAVVPQMTTRGGGVIVLMTSMAGRQELDPPKGLGIAYPVAKAGLIRFVAVLAEEVREDGVAVIGLDPGFTRSEHVEQGQKDGLYLGWDISLAHSPDVPAAAVGHLCGCPDPLRYTGRNLSAPEIVAEHSLLPADAP